MTTPNFIVTAAAQRPARMDGTCFYCNQAIGAAHKEDCVLVIKKVKVRVAAEYEIEVPAHWDKEHIEFFRNQSSSCGDNVVMELLGHLEEYQETRKCGCGALQTTFLEETSKPYVRE